jgi:pyruvate dehydrogenase (quinone)
VAQTASEALVERLIDWGVDTVFGLPGDGVNGIMAGLRRHQDRLRFVLVHHEEAAAFMAVAYAKATGKLGVCLAASGPGGIRLLNGLYDAKLDRVPVLAVTGTPETSLADAGYQPEVALDNLYADVAEYDVMISGPARVPAVVDLAIRTACERRGVAHITVSGGIQVADEGAGPWRDGAPVAPRALATRPGSPGLPPADDLRRLADLLNEGGKIAILAGAGALRAREELIAVAEALDAPIVKTPPGKAAVPDDSPYTTGGIGPLGTKPSQDLMDEIDTLLMAGTSSGDTRHLPPRARCARIEAGPARSGAGAPDGFPVTGDARQTLRALLPLLKPRTEHEFLARYTREMNAWRRSMAALEDPELDPIAPQYLMATLSELAADDAVLTCDGGAVATWAARHWNIRDDRQFYPPGNLATTAPGLPYAIGVQHAFPGRQVIAFVGDGGFAMLMAEFLTAVRHRLPVKVVINNGHAPGQVPCADYAAFATANGALGAKVTEPGDLPGAVQLALNHPGPALVDVNVSAAEPPGPDDVRPDQAKACAVAFLPGQPHRATIATTLLKDRVQQVGP